jgi:hypothetical protein
MRISLLLLLTLLTVGCASRTPDVKPTEDGQYTVTAEAMSHASNGAAIARHKAIKIADKFCEKKERTENTVTFDDKTTDTSYVSALVFTCR